MNHSRRSMLAAGLACWLGPPAWSAAPARIKVVASFSILADFVARVGGERVEVTSLVGPDSDIHAFEPSPAQAAKLAGAGLIVVNGLGLEGWLDRLVRASGSKARLVAAATGIRVMAAKEQAGHSHGRHGHRHGHDDPHAWQEVANAVAYVRAIRDALAAVDPGGQETYEQNAKAYTAELESLEREIKAAVARIPPQRRKVITSHDAFGYFGRAYGIAFIAPRGVSAQADATARDVARIVRQIKAEKVPAVFLENVSDPRLMEQIARESGARIGGRVYSDALSDPAGPAGSYVAMMRHNLNAFVAALGD